MSRAFVKEDDGEFSSLKDDEAYGKKTTEFLRLQEKKLDFLLNDPKGQMIEASKRQKWIEEAQEAIEVAKKELGL